MAPAAYEKKYGTEADRNKRREVQALARVKAMSEREKLERDEQRQLTEVIMASLSEVCWSCRVELAGHASLFVVCRQGRALF